MGDKKWQHECKGTCPGYEFGNDEAFSSGYKAGYGEACRHLVKTTDQLKKQLDVAVEALLNLKDCQNTLREWEYANKAYITIVHEYHRYVGEATEEALNKIKQMMDEE